MSLKFLPVELRDSHVALRMEGSMKKRIETLARQEKRTTSDVMRLLLEEALKARKAKC
jgi:predicted DNA-binding protein